MPVPSAGDGIDALDARALDARMRATLAAMHRVQWQTGRLLRLVFDLRLHRLLQFRTAAQYVKEGKLGTRRDGPPLLTLIGDRYVNDDPIVA